MADPQVTVTTNSTGSSTPSLKDEVTKMAVELLSSKKFWVLVAGILLEIAPHFGLHLLPDEEANIRNLIITYLLSQGIVDSGILAKLKASPGIGGTVANFIGTSPVTPSESKEPK